MGKTWKDDKVISRHKAGAREMTADMDLRTRTKPLVKKERRSGGKNLVRELDSFLEDEYDDKYTEDSDENF